MESAAHRGMALLDGRGGLGYSGSAPVDTTITQDPGDSDRAPRAEEPAFALVVAWAAEPGHTGEILRVPAKQKEAGWVFGRGEAPPGEPRRLMLVRQRPGWAEPSQPLTSRFLSRDQLLLRCDTEGVSVENRGRVPMRVRGGVATQARLAPGEVLELTNQLVLLCVRRATSMPPIRDYPEEKVPAFGRADPQGIVGESPLSWQLREQVAFIAKRGAHVLLLGESGTGKELAAQAIHELSSRGRRTLVARNAVTFPAGLIDAELFGNVKNYPNPGMPERSGLVGEADGSTLFLDEIGELPPELQTHLLRVLDAGEYQRLGEPGRRRSSLRLVAATNRSVEDLKHDLVARLKLRLTLPGLNERLEDVPLLVEHLLRETAAEDAEIGERFFAAWDGRTGQVRVSPSLVRALVEHRYRTHVRELDALLWHSLATSDGDRLELTDAVQSALDPAASRGSSPPPPDLSPEAIAAAMARHDGVQERVWRELGLANRYVLKRLLKKHALGPYAGRGDDEG